MNVGNEFGHYGWKMVFACYWVMNKIASNGPKTTMRTHFFQIIGEGGLGPNLAFNGVYTNHNEFSPYRVRHKIGCGVFTLLTCE